MRAHAHTKTRKEAWEPKAQKQNKKEHANPMQMKPNKTNTHKHGMRQYYRRFGEREREGERAKEIEKEGERERGLT